jgi:hypothetical protein
MSTIHRSRTIVSAFAATFMVALSAPFTVHAEDQLLAEEQALAPASVPGPSVSVEDSRVGAAQHALLSPDLGSLQEEALMAVLAAAMSWDETSGYGSVEASRAAHALAVVPETSTTWVPSDVRWAPARVIAPGSSVEEMRVLAAQQGLQSRDLGSLQEETLFAVVATGASWDQTSGYGTLEAIRASIGHSAASTTAAANRVAAAMSWDETSGYGSVEASRAARASRSVLPAPSAAPTLSDASAMTQTSTLFTVSGVGFTVGGRVYLAIYDQMGAQLYETRWITASIPLLAVMGPTGHEAASITGHGGTLREAFANLCGATAMMRGYDESTTTWSNWLTVEPACGAYVAPTSGPR